MNTKEEKKSCENCRRYPSCSVWSMGDVIDAKTRKPIYERKSPKEYSCGAWNQKLECSSGKPVRLHLGCSNRLLKGWINCDILPPEGTTYTTDVIVGKPFEIDGCEFRVMDVMALNFEDKTIDEIYASHVLDHLSRKKEVDYALSEWYRVLKPGGVLRVAVSDFEKVVTMYNEGLALERLLGHIVGGHKTDFDHHGIVFDFKLLRQYLEKHGFHDVQRYDWREFLPKDFDDLSQCFIPHMNKENGILMSLNVEARKL